MKHIIILGSAFVIVCLLAFSLFFGNGSFEFPQIPAVKTTLDFLHPVCVAIDTAKNIYFVDNKYYRIVKLNSQGSVVYEFQVNPENKKNHFEYFSEIGVDGAGNLYAARVIYFLENELVDREEIVKYNPQGRKEQVLYTLKHAGDEDIYDARLLTLQVDGDYLYFDVREEAAVQLWRVKTTGGEPEQVLTLQAGKNDIYNLCGIAPGNLFACSYSGEKVYRLDEKSELAELTLANPDPEAPGILLADKIIRGMKEDFYLTDLFSQCIFRVRDARRISRFYTEQSLADWNYPARHVLFKDLWMNKDGYMAVIEQVLGRILIINPGGGTEKIFSSGKYPFLLILNRCLLWGELIAFLGMAAFILLYIYTALLKRRLALFFKLILTFIPIAVVLVYFISTLTFQSMYTRYIEEVFNRLTAIVCTGEKLADKEAVARLSLPAHFQNDDYNRVLASLETLLGKGNDDWNRRVYVNVLKLYNDMFYIVAGNTGTYRVMYPFIYAPEAYYKSYNNATIEKAEYTDADGSYIEAIAPMIDNTGKVTAILTAGYSRGNFRKLHDIFINELTINIIIATCVFLAATSFTALFILLTIRKLRKAVTQVAKGNFDVQVNVHSKDEIGDLGKGFNTMSRYIQDYIREITDLYIAYAKFVPKEFLRFLKKENITELELGNQTQMNMTILFSDIRAFTTLSEQMTPQENFNFINSYLSRIGPIIRENNGFIDKYIGDAIMALFPGDSSDAVKAAAAMQKELVVYNSQRASCGYKAIQTGIGIHAGKVILGILGEHERIAGTVISDAVNIASRLEELTKYYGDNILLSEGIVRKLTNRNKMPYRLLDKVVVKGKTESLYIYGFFGADPEELYRYKYETLENFEKAVKLFHDGNIPGADNIFTKLYKVNKRDKAVVQYILRCRKKETLLKK